MAKGNLAVEGIGIAEQHSSLSFPHQSTTTFTRLLNCATAPGRSAPQSAARTRRGPRQSRPR